MPINSEQVLVNSVLSNSSPAPSKLLQIGETGERAELAFCKWGKKEKAQRNLSWEMFLQNKEFGGLNPQLRELGTQRS